MIANHKRANKPFSLLIKPASADCNLNCTYCFYLKKCQLYSESARHRMPEEVLERVIESYMQTDQPIYSFGWQGGEPTLMGLSFFQKVVALQQKYGQPGASVANGLQTNATLIDRAFADHLAQYRFLVGCSLDGPADIHDIYRTNKTGHPSHSNVIQGLNNLKRSGVSYNILVLVSQANINRAAEIYQYLVGEGHFYHQYIPCVEFDEKEQPLPFSISGSEWGQFLCELFDTWYPNDIHNVSIRHFDSVLSKIVDGSETVCTLGSNCCQYFVVEHNGDIYPCDFFVEQQLKLGNISSTSWRDLLESPQYLEFGARKNAWNISCNQCDCLDLCVGDCLKHRIYSGHREDNTSFLCEGWKRFIRHSRDSFNELACQVSKERGLSSSLENDAVPSKIPNPRVGRNTPCPCGSGLKFKKCCGKTK